MARVSGDSDSLTGPPIEIVPFSIFLIFHKQTAVSKTFGTVRFMDPYRIKTVTIYEISWVI